MIHANQKSDDLHKYIITCGRDLQKVVRDRALICVYPGFVKIYNNITLMVPFLSDQGENEMAQVFYFGVSVFYHALLLKLCSIRLISETYFGLYA